VPLLNYPPCSADLAPTDYHVLRSLTDSVHGHKFYSDEEVIYAVNDWFEHQDKKFSMDGVISLACRSEKCVALLGDYIEKL